MTTKKAKEVKADPIGSKDKVVVTYQNKFYDIDHVPGIVMRANNRKGFKYQVRLQDDEGQPINKGHDQNQGEPGSGPFIFCDEEHLTLVEKYEPKRLAGDVKEKWKIGDKFMLKEDFDVNQDDVDDVTGVTPEMLELKGQELTVIGIMTRTGPTMLIDGTENFGWLPEWVDPVE